MNNKVKHLLSNGIKIKTFYLIIPVDRWQNKMTYLQYLKPITITVSRF